jgi:hypothetical protein
MTEAEGKARLGAVERLDLMGFPIDVEHHRARRRVGTEP